MIRFSCERCQTKVKVPDGFAGKRVKCPGCGEAVRVPEPAAVEASAGPDLSLLEALDAAPETHAGKARKLRMILLGCGACGKTIKVPENQLGTDLPCPKCKTGLRVPRLDLPPVVGKGNIDLKHITLEPLLGDAGGGSLAGRTAMHATGSLAGMSGSGPSVGGATTSQEQMQQLRAINDARAEGSITEEEYRRKKAEIYANAGNQAALARAATSRGPAGMGQTIALGRKRTSMIPGPLKLVAVLALLGAGGFAAWQTYVQYHWRDWLAMVTGEERPSDAADGETVASADGTDGSADADATAAGDGDAPDVANASLVPAGGVGITTDPGATDRAPVQVIEATTVWVHPGGRLADFAVAPAGFREATPDVVPDDVLIVPTAPPPPPPEADPAVVTAWNGVYFPDSDVPHPFREFSTFVKAIGTNEAFIGVGAGPPAEGLDDPAYLRYRERVRRVYAMANTPDFAALQADPVNDRLVRNENGVSLHLLTARSAPGGSAGGVQLLLYTGVQDGACVAYWYHGAASLQLARDFRNAIGKATLTLPTPTTP